VTLTFDLLTLKLVRNVTCVIGYAPANFGDTTTIHYRFMGHWANTAQTDHMTLWPWRSRRLWLMRVVVLHPCAKFEVRRPWHFKDMVHDVCQHSWTWWPWPLTLKLVCKLHPRWGTFLPNSGILGIWFLELFAMYATDRQTNGQTDRQKQCLLLLSYGQGHNNNNVFKNNNNNNTLVRIYTPGHQWVITIHTCTPGH